MPQPKRTIDSSAHASALRPSPSSPSAHQRGQRYLRQELCEFVNRHSSLHHLVDLVKSLKSRNPTNLARFLCPATSAIDFQDNQPIQRDKQNVNPSTAASVICSHGGPHKPPRQPHHSSLAPRSLPLIRLLDFGNLCSFRARREATVLW